MTTKNYLSIYAKSFKWSGFFLPKKIYFKCSVLYDFCRTIDNIADRNIDLDIKKIELKEFRENFEKKNKNNSVIRNMWDLMDRKNISKKIVDDLFDGVNSDLKKEVRIKTEKELLIYSYRVAGTVGLMMSKILKVNNKEALKGAIDLGIAMQLTNIARDVCEDKARNRQYIKHNFLSIKQTIDESRIFYDKSFSSISFLLGVKYSAFKPKFCAPKIETRAVRRDARHKAHYGSEVVHKNVGRHQIAPLGAVSADEAIEEDLHRHVHHSAL